MMTQERGEKRSFRIRSMRLYRGLSEPYQPERIGRAEFPRGTDFTDCPLTALGYARGQRGVVLVVEVEDSDSTRISEELWQDHRARRLMIWGHFDRHIVAVFPAKDLRAQVRRKGVAAQSWEYRSEVLREYIERRLNGGSEL